MKKTNYFGLAIIPLIALFFGACSSGELTREKAENLIKPLYPKDIVKTIQVDEIVHLGEGWEYFAKDLMMHYYGNNLYKFVDKAKDAGLVTINETYLQYHPKFSYYPKKVIKYEVTISTKGKEYLTEVNEELKEQVYQCKNNQKQKYLNKKVTYNAKVGIYEFNSITGIFLENENEAEIEYTTKYNETPWHIAYPHNLKDGETYTYKLKARKFDDGWRLVD